MRSWAVAEILNILLMDGMTGTLEQARICPEAFYAYGKSSARNLAKQFKSTTRKFRGTPGGKVTFHNHSRFNSPSQKQLKAFEFQHF
jgi:hypothetical protein